MNIIKWEDKWETKGGQKGGVYNRWQQGEGDRGKFFVSSLNTPKLTLPAFCMTFCFLACLKSANLSVLQLLQDHCSLSLFKLLA